MTAPTPFADYVASVTAGDDFCVFPCRPNGKEPACAHGHKDASADEAQLRAWAAENPRFNVGHCPEHSGHWVLDIDAHKGGVESLTALIAAHGPLPESYSVRTPRGGRHLWFRGSVPSSVERIGKGLDVRGRNGYVLLPGSVTADGTYTEDCSVPAVQAPAWLLQLANSTNPNATEPSPLAGEPFTPDQLTAMLRFLDPDCPRDEWRDIAAALHAAPCTDSDFDKRDLFVRWSRGEVRHED